MFVVTTVVLVWRFAGSKNGGAQKDARRGHFCDGSQAGVGISEYLGIIYRINFILYNRIYNIVQFGTWELDFRILGNYLPNLFLLVKQHVIFGTSEAYFRILGNYLPNSFLYRTPIINEKPFLVGLQNIDRLGQHHTPPGASKKISWRWSFVVFFANHATVRRQ